MRKLKSLVIILLMAMAMGSPITIPIINTMAVVEAATIHISENKLTLAIGKSKLLKISGTKKKIVWKSSKKSVAIVSSKGKVTAKAAGIVKITATVGSKMYTCVVTVKKPLPITTPIPVPTSTSTPTETSTNTLKASSASMEFATGSALNGIVKSSAPPLDVKPSTEVVNSLNQLVQRIIYLNNYCDNGEYKIVLTGFTLSDDDAIQDAIFHNKTMFGNITNYTQRFWDNKIIEVDVKVEKTILYELTRGFEDERYFDTTTTQINADAKEIFSTVKDILLKNITSDMADYKKEKAIHDFMVNQYAYDQDLDIYTVKELLLSKEGVCQAYADTFRLFMNLMGINCITQTGEANGGGHAWNMVMLDEEWYHVDVTWDDPIADRDILRYDYFNITDKQMSKDHTWVPTKGITATALKYAYPYDGDLDNFYTVRLSLW